MMKCVKLLHVTYCISKETSPAPSFFFKGKKTHTRAPDGHFGLFHQLWTLSKVP